VNRLVRFLFLLLVLGPALRPGGLLAQVPLPGQTRPGGQPGTGTTPGQPAPGRTDGQILDDSTRQIYGPTTTRYFLEPDVRANRKYLYAIDTAFLDFHRYLYPARLDHRYTDLGNSGTALRPLYYEAPAQIGAQLGYDAYAPYGLTPATIKYYDTKSPFSHVYYAQGGRGQTIFDFEFSRNVNERFNLGLLVHRVSGNKQYGFTSRTGSFNREERLVDHWSFVLHANYRSKNDRYTLLAHFNQSEHKGSEQGGVDSTRSLVDGRLVQLALNERGAWLDRATFRNRVNHGHVYQEYQWTKGLQFYHAGDIQTRFNRFTDADVATSLYTTPVYPRPRDSTGLSWLEANARYYLIENRVGAKGTFQGFNYRLHLRRRDFGITQRAAQIIGTDTLQNDRRRRANENFLGLWLGYYFADSTRLTAEGEYLLGRDYRLHGEYQGRWFRARLTSATYSPTLLQEGFSSPILSWSVNLRNTFVNQVQASIPLRLGTLRLEPSAQYALVRNYIYFDTLATVQQTAVPLSVFQLGLALEYQRNRWRTGLQAYAARSTGADVLRMPALVATGRLSYELVFAKVLYVQMGVELHYKTAYFADAYQPLTQQFYLNDRFRVPGYLLADAFLNLRINRVRLFFKIAHANDGLMPTAYFTTPGYPGMPRALGLGVSWLLFD
jgi:hypothetical protein